MEFIGLLVTRPLVASLNCHSDSADSASSVSSQGQALNNFSACQVG